MIDNRVSLSLPGAVLDSGEEWSESDMDAVIAQLAARLRLDPQAPLVSVDVGGSPLVKLVIALVLANRFGWDLDLGRNAVVTAAMATPGEYGGCTPFLKPPSMPGQPMVHIQTSGTTNGTRRNVTLPQRRLFRPTNDTTSLGGTLESYGLAYELCTYGALAAIAQVLQRGVDRIERIAPEDLRNTKQPSLQVIGGTPSFWRSVIRATASPARVVLRATMGGEPVDGKLIAAVKSRFPGVRVRQIYGTTENGTLAVVDDELPGLPVASLALRSHRGALKVENGVLWVRAADRNTWQNSGDRVTVQNGRVIFLGRVDSSINVGGVKVSPQELERIAASVKGVYDARVFPWPSPVVGQVVSLDVVCDRIDYDEVCVEIRRLIEATLGRHARPRRIRLVDRIRLTSAGKRDNVNR